MKKHMLSACAAAMALALSGPALAQPSTDPLLQSHIAVTWNAPVQGLAEVLAERLALPFFDSSGATPVTVALNQGEGATVAQALEAINAQIISGNLTLGLTQGAHGHRLELSRTQPASAVAAVAAVDAEGASEQVTLTSQQALPVHATAQVLESWEITPADATLRNSLRKWTEKAGWQLLWEAGSDVPIPVKASFEGDFRTAVLALFDTLSASEVALNALMYRGNKVLRVVEVGHRAE